MPPSNKSTSELESAELPSLEDFIHRTISKANNASATNREIGVSDYPKETVYQSEEQILLRLGQVVENITTGIAPETLSEHTELVKKIAIMSLRIPVERALSETERSGRMKTIEERPSKRGAAFKLSKKIGSELNIDLRINHPYLLKFLQHIETLLPSPQEEILATLQSLQQSDDQGLSILSKIRSKSLPWISAELTEEILTEKKEMDSSTVIPILDLISGHAEAAFIELDITEGEVMSLLTKLIATDQINNNLFARLNSFVFFDKLPERVQRWYRSKGLTETPLKYGTHSKFKVSHCHECGEIIVSGAPSMGPWTRAEGFIKEGGRGPIWPPTVNTAVMTKLQNKGDESPWGMEINVSTIDKSNVSYIVTRGFVTSSNPAVRGILVPNSTPWIHNVYITQRHSVSKALDGGSHTPQIYLLATNSDVAMESHFAFNAVTRYLNGEIPSLTGDYVRDVK